MIYLDNHATTQLAPAAWQAMMPFMQELYANPGSITHQFGRSVAESVDQAITNIAAMIGAQADELVITSGATESNNLALMGVMLHRRQKRRRVISVVTEHKAVVDPLNRLAQQGFDVHWLPVAPQSTPNAGQLDLDQLSDAIDDQTALVSVMLANNEIGVIQPLSEIARLCHDRGCWLHTDASQAIGKMHCLVDDLGVDLMSFSAHKFYGPKGVGGLFVRRHDRIVTLQGQILGGGQQHNLRSGTLNSAGIVGMQVALLDTLENYSQDQPRIRLLRDRLFQLLSQQLEIQLNGPPLKSDERLQGNLNCCFYPLEGQSLMMHAPQLAISSGSACTSANPEPSHVLRALGLSDDHSRSSLRFGIGRFNSPQEIELAVQMLVSASEQLRKRSL